MSSTAVPVACGFLLNCLGYCATTRTGTDLRRHLAFTVIQWSSDIIRSMLRYFVVTSICERRFAAMLLIWPLTVFETTMAQWMMDMHERRPFVPMTRTQLANCLRVACVEGAGVLAAIELGPRSPLRLVVSTTSPPSARAILSLVVLSPLFDLGLDLGFYTFHRACHVNKTLFALVHQDHHTDTAKAHGRLVAYETYSITWAETLSIFVCYQVYRY